MSTQIREYVVFIASPSGCDDERAEVRAAVERSNSAFRSHSLSFRVTGWETTTPAFGRAQELINPLVDECDIFIGILGVLWGSPSGKESSGFLEEFRRAENRRTDGSDFPHISLHFRTPPPEMLRDPGPELKAVLEFKKQIRETFKALYSEHSSASEFGNTVFASLTEFGLTVLAADSTASRSSKPETDDGTPRPEPTDEPLDEARTQLMAATQLAADVFGGRATTWFDRDRLLLLAKAFAVDEELIPEHLANRVYSKRDDYVLSRGEAHTILRTLLADIGNDNDTTSRVIPAWGYFRKPQGGPLRASDLDELAEFTADHAGISRAALFILSTENARPKHLWPRAGTKKPPTRFKERWASALDKAGPDAVARYISTVATTSDHDFLTGLAKDPDLANFEDLLLALSEFSSGEPLALARYALDSSVINRDSYIPVLEASITDLASTELDALIRKAWTPAPLKRRALGVLADNDAVDQALVDHLLKDDNGLWDTLFDLLLTHQPIATLVIAAVNRPDDKKPSLRVQDRVRAATIRDDVNYEDLNYEDLTYASRWDGIAKRDPDAAIEPARRILADDANTYRAHLQQQDLATTHPDLVDYLVAQLTATALNALARRPDPHDATIFAKYIADAEPTYVLRRPALDGFLKTATFETDEDIAVLKNVNRYWLDTDIVLERMKSNEPAFLRAIATVDRSDLRGPAIELLATSGKLSSDELVDMLYDKEGYVRVAAARGLIKTLPADELPQLLASYRSDRDWHWYNVVALLDQAIYGPPALRMRTRSDAAHS